MGRTSTIGHRPSDIVDTATYCRDVETYLCRKNDGHLIRIVGPVFEQVCGWAERGVPLAIVQKGIDRYCERYYAKGPRRRPVRVEFCEADILDLFDDWRRAVGVPQAALSASDQEAASSGAAHETLPAHLDRAVARLTAARASGSGATALGPLLDSIVRELDRSRAAARTSRGDQRAALLERLAALDRELMDAATRGVDAERLTALRHDAEAEIAPFAGRMAAADRHEAVERAFSRLLRNALGLPVLTFSA